jgi:NADPH:quinone reductase-like Zn-dependent oxidoreductase
MRAVHAVRFGGPEVLTTVEIDRPKPISTEVLVEVHAAGVNPVDYKTRGGGGVAAWVGPPPYVPGWDVAGVVVGAGYGVTRFEPGDRVFGMPRFPRLAGAYAEYLAAPSLQLSGIPDGVDFEQAAAIPLAALTAWQALADAAAVSGGDVVLIHGASGGVGHLAVQIAVSLGASVIATAGRPAHEFLRRLGAAELVDRGAVADGHVREGVDVAVDLVGGADTGSLLQTLREGGVLVAIADGATEQTKAQAERLGVKVLEPLVEPDGRGLDSIGAMVARGSLTVAVQSVLALEQAAEAHRRLEAGGVRGKVVLSVRRPRGSARR